MTESPNIDAIDRSIINALQGGFPVARNPYALAAKSLGLDEGELIARLKRLLSDGVLSRFGPLIDAERLGGAVTLAAMAVPEEQFEAVAALVNDFPEVAHNYERSHALNMWFVVNSEEPQRVAAVLRKIESVTGLKVYDLPKETEYFLELKLSA